MKGGGKLVRHDHIIPKENNLTDLEKQTNKQKTNLFPNCLTVEFFFFFFAGP